VLGIPYTGSGVVGLRALLGQGARQARAARRRAPDARLGRLQRDGVPRARRRRGARGDRAATRVPARRQARRRRARRSGSSSPHAGGRAGRARRRLLLRPQGPARALRRTARAGGLDPRARTGRRALPIVEAVPRDGTSTTSRRATTSGARPSSARPRSSRRLAERAQEVALAAYELLGCYGFARVDMMLARSGEPQILEINPIPGLTETSLLPQAADAAGIDFDELVARGGAVELARSESGGLGACAEARRRDRCMRRSAGRRMRRPVPAISCRRRRSPRV
jgi:hypothetical protein